MYYTVLILSVALTKEYARNFQLKMILLLRALTPLREQPH